MKSGLVRNLEQIQEAESKPVTSRLGTVLLVSLGGACVVFAVASRSQKGPAPRPLPDALGELALRAHAAASASGAASALELAGKDVTFPTILSDEVQTTTALAALRTPGASPATSATSRTAKGVVGTGGLSISPSVPPLPTDTLAVVPLPAKHVVSPSPLVSRPRDTLTQIAKGGLQASGPAVEEGHTGGYQLQVSSFRNEGEANAFATALRQRGHRAYVETAHVEGRGTWFRVRVGPFKSKAEAAAYRADFEHREHLAPFLVDPNHEVSPSRPSSQH